MSNTFSFIKHPVESLHDFFPELMPGIRKVISVHTDGGKLKGLLSQKNGNSYSTLSMDMNSMIGTMEECRAANTPYDWYSPDSLPFEVQHRDKKVIKDIFSELENVVLLIRLPDTKRVKNAMIFVYLNENPGNFGVSNTENFLTTDTKSMIAFLLRNLVVSYIRQQEKNLGIFIAHNLHTRSIIDQAQQGKNEFQQTRQNYGMSLVELCKQYIQEYEQKSGKEFILSEGAIEKIKNYKLDLKQLPDRVLQSLAYAESLYLGENRNQIEILDWHLRLESTESPLQAMRSNEHPGQKYEKTIILLNKLEDAALRVKSESLKMTGTNVGQAFQQPITAPAISDALFNHKSKINSLVSLYPDKWETIRNEFRPLKNILRNE